MFCGRIKFLVKKTKNMSFLDTCESGSCFCKEDEMNFETVLFTLTFAIQ